MPARSIGTATISFGLVSVPVNLYSPSESKASVSFNMLHKKCGTRLKQQYICPKDNEIVTRDDTVKGYEFAKDQYVILTPEELKALEEKATDTIDIIEFVPLAKVDREYLEKVYYLGPGQGRRPRLSSARRGAGGDRPRRARPVRGARPAVPRAAAPAQRRARDGAAALRRRSCVRRPKSTVPEGDGEAGRAQAREAAHRADRRPTSSSPRSTRTPCASGCSRRSSARSRARTSPSERRRSAAARSSTSWRR